MKTLHAYTPTEVATNLATLARITKEQPELVVPGIAELLTSTYWTVFERKTWGRGSN